VDNAAAWEGITNILYYDLPDGDYTLIDGDTRNKYFG
jgi:hypothetical protein